jgi:hypothetical protein
MITNLTIVIERIDATIMVNTTTRMQRATNLMTRRMIASTITLRNKSNKAMHNDQFSLSSTGNLLGKRIPSCSRSSLRSQTWSCSCSSSWSYNNHNVNQDDCKPSAAPMRGYLYSEDNNDGHYHCMDKNNSVFATFSAPKAKKKRTQNRELCQ